MSSSSISSSSELEPEAVDFRRFFFCLDVCTAQSGAGYKRSNCSRSRRVYSLPLTTSSPSLDLSFRSRGFEASDTINRSSSESSHASGSPWRVVELSSDGAGGANVSGSIAAGAESM